MPTGVRYFFTKSKSLKHLIIILFLALPLKEMASKNIGHIPTLAASLIDVYHMAATIEAETGGEPERCKCLVGEVLENRAFDQKTNVSKSAKNGVKMKKPSPESIKIAKKILSSQHKHHLLFFHNPKTATDKKWLRRTANRKKAKCGKQEFFE